VFRDPKTHLDKIINYYFIAIEGTQALLIFFFFCLSCTIGSDKVESSSFFDKKIWLSFSSSFLLIYMYIYFLKIRSLVFFLFWFTETEGCIY
jgi:hypothetical protein